MVFAKLFCNKEKQKMQIFLSVENPVMYFCCQALFEFMDDRNIINDIGYIMDDFINIHNKRRSSIEDTF